MPVGQAPVRHGGFSPVTVSLSQNTTTAVLPQSMRFIDSLGQLAVADAVLRDPRPQGGVPCASAFPEK